LPGFVRERVPLVKIGRQFTTLAVPRLPAQR